MAPSDPEQAPRREPAAAPKPVPEAQAEPESAAGVQAAGAQPEPEAEPTPEPGAVPSAQQADPSLAQDDKPTPEPGSVPSPQQAHPSLAQDDKPAPEPELAAEPELAELEPAPAQLASAPAPDSAEPAVARPRRGPGRWVWPLVVCILAALLGLAVGVGAALRGRSLGSGVSGGTVARPTFVIGAAVSPVPSRAPSPVVPGPAPTSATAEYVVEPGDTLRSIAQHIYGDADQWPRIYDANRDLIGPDPDALQAGMRLRTP